MQDLRHELAALRTRLRLQTIVTFGALAALAFAMGGADATARILVEADAWKVRTKNAAGSADLDRIVCTTGADIARIRVQDANIELAQQTSPVLSPNAGALWFDSSTGVNRLKVYSGTAWAEPGSPAFRQYSLQSDPGSEVKWLNMPTSLTEMSFLRQKIDFTGVNQFRLTCIQTTAGYSGFKMRVYYSTNLTNWFPLEDTTTTADLPADSTANPGPRVGAWGPIIAAAKEDVYISVWGYNGNGTVDPGFRMIALQVK